MIIIEQTSVQHKNKDTIMRINNTKYLFFEKTNSNDLSRVITNSKERRPQKIILEME